MLLPVGPPSHIVPYRPVNLLYGVIDARSCITPRVSICAYRTLRYYRCAARRFTPRNKYVIVGSSAAAFIADVFVTEPFYI